MIQGELFDGTMEGVYRKEVGQQRVASHNPYWMEQAASAVLHFLPKGWIGMACDWRTLVIKACGHPLHPNAWGPLTTMLLKAGVIKPTGRRFKSRLPSANAHKYDEYIKTK